MSILTGKKKKISDSETRRTDPGVIPDEFLYSRVLEPNFVDSFSQPYFILILIYDTRYTTCTVMMATHADAALD